MANKDVKYKLYFDGDDGIRVYSCEEDRILDSTRHNGKVLIRDDPWFIVIDENKHTYIVHYPCYHSYVDWTGNNLTSFRCINCLTDFPDRIKFIARMAK
jgi:hypothetical protein